MNKFKEEYFALFVFIFIILSWFSSGFDLWNGLNYAGAATSSQVTVSATVLATVSC